MKRRKRRCCCSGCCGNDSSDRCSFKNLITRREMRLAGVKYIRINKIHNSAGRGPSSQTSRRESKHVQPGSWFSVRLLEEGRSSQAPRAKPAAPCQYLVGRFPNVIKHYKQPGWRCYETWPRGRCRFPQQRKHYEHIKSVAFVSEKSIPHLLQSSR